MGLCIRYRTIHTTTKTIKSTNGCCLRGIHDTLTSAYSAVKSDLEAAQAELQILKQEVIKSSKNPFGAGRKPKLTVEQVEQVKMLSAEGLSVRKIAAKMDCSAALICKLLKEDHK